MATSPPETGDHAERLDLEKLARAKQETWDSYVKQRGTRYKPCRFETFNVAIPPQKSALESVRAVARLEHKSLPNMVLTGKCGTGKDHLATAAVFELVARMDGKTSRFGVEFCSGAMLFSRLRDAITDEKTEREVLSPLCGASLLVLSDLCQSGGTLTEYQRQIVYRVVDQRYNNCKPVWLTINATGRAGLCEMLGAAVVDRLLDGAVVVECNWESYRKLGSVSESPTTNGRAAG